MSEPAPHDDGVRVLASFDLTRRVVATATAPAPNPAR
jgi:hypothetical protein